MKNKTIRIPGNYFSVTGEKNRTIHLQNKNTGLMTGRKDTTGSGDKTANIRIEKYVDLNKNKRTDKGDLFPGQIVGRVGQGESKPRSLDVVKVKEHTRSGRIEVKRHFRKVH